MGKTSRPFEAKWAGTCAECGNSWKPGVLIQYRNNKLCHVKCEGKGKHNGKGGGTFFKKVMDKARSYIKDESEAIPETIENKLFVPSRYQQAAFDWATSGSGHAVMKAVAGSGKTTTIVKILDILPRDIRILFVAFNRNIVKTLKARVRAAGYDNVEVRTLNSAGNFVCMKYPGYEKVQGDKVMDILSEFWEISKEKVKDPKVRSANRIKRQAMKKLVEMVKATLTDFNDPDAVLDLITRFHIELDSQMEQEIIERLPYVMETNNDNLEVIDYNDQCYLPLVHPFFADKFEQYDFILCDEFQDFNRSNIEFIIKCLAPNGRIIAVGDHHQSLYGFRGADPRAIPDAIERLNATVLPLSVCYRCPKSHIRRIKKLRPEIDIEPAETAIEGVLEDLHYEQMVEKAREGDMIICRTNAPLIKPAFEIIRNGQKAVIRGKDIGRDLVNFIEQFQVDTLARLDILMQQQTEIEIEYHLSRNKEMLAEQAKERYQTIAEVAKEVKTVSDLILKLETLFSDDTIGVVLSSVHRAKGLESEVIFLYRDELMPHPKAKSDDEIEQEWNAIYVAGTRSLNELYIVKGEAK